MNRNITIEIGEFYHVYSRGVEQRKIFSDEADLSRFQSLLYLCNSTKPIVYRDLPIGLTLGKAGEQTYASPYEIDVGEKVVAIAAYVFMPNHFHLILKEIREGGITEFMRKTLTAYSMFFNKKHDRVGHLFQGTFQAKHLNSDEYLKYQFAYTHLNPIKLLEPKWKEAGIKNKKITKIYLENYRYSSYQDYIGIKRKEAVILTRNKFPEYFDTQHDFEDFVKDWLTYKEEVDI